MRPAHQISGVIAIFSKRGVLLRRQRYNNRGHRARIMARWVEEYEDAYNTCYLEIAPDTQKKVQLDAKLN